MSINCPACQKPNDAGMRFCIYCGCGLFEAEEQSNKGGQSCPSCGKFDELNIKFCVFCGSQIQEESEKLTPPQVSRPSWEMDAPPPLQQRTSTTRAPVQPPPARKLEKRVPLKAQKGSNPFLWIAAGILTGGAFVVAAVYLHVPQASARLALPTRGLVLYTQKPNITFVVQDEEGQHYTIGSTGAGGSLAIDDLPPGSGYKLKMSGEKSDTVYFPPFELEESKATIVGFPNRVLLPARNL
ncbi:MAG TPA: zinc ribbon domain-containing protein [Candidatus Obscuribacterales bacterium]